MDWTQWQRCRPSAGSSSSWSLRQMDGLGSRSASVGHKRPLAIDQEVLTLEGRMVFEVVLDYWHPRQTKARQVEGFRVETRVARYRFPPLCWLVVAPPLLLLQGFLPWRLPPHRPLVASLLGSLQGLPDRRRKRAATAWVGSLAENSCQP